MPEQDAAKWIRCPHCGTNTRTKVYPDTVLLKCPVFCKKCRRETIVNVIKLKMTIESDEPDV